MRRLFPILMVLAGCGSDRVPKDDLLYRGSAAPASFRAAPEGPWIESGKDEGFLFLDGRFATIDVEPRPPPRHLRRCRYGPNHRVHAGYIEFVTTDAAAPIIVHYELVDGGAGMVLDDHRNPPAYVVRPIYDVTLEDCEAEQEQFFPVAGTRLSGGVTAGLFGD